MEVLYYRDCRSYAQYKYAICSVGDAAKVEGPYNVAQNWSPSIKDKETLMTE